MPNFSVLSDTDSDSNSDTAAAVNELIAQTKDFCVLQQISAINCSAFSDDSVLASDLESRFARLKSFPSNNPTPKPEPTRSLTAELKIRSPTLSSPNPIQSKRIDSQRTKTPSFSSSNSSPAAKRFDSKDFNSKRFATTSYSVTDSKRLGSSSIGCTFWCSPKNGSSSNSGKKKKKSNEMDWARRNDFGWSKNEELLEDLGSFSIEEQRRILKKAMAEQRKISKEATKIVKMAKKASLGKKSVGNNDIEDELSD